MRQGGKADGAINKVSFPSPPEKIIPETFGGKEIRYTVAGGSVKGKGNMDACRIPSPYFQPVQTVEKKIDLFIFLQGCRRDVADIRCAGKFYDFLHVPEDVPPGSPDNVAQQDQTTIDGFHFAGRKRACIFINQPFFTG